MSEHLFVIAAGGTGAKVTVAVGHVCAAGLGQEKLDVLLVDGDASNGNRTRAVKTWEAYRKLQRWPWTVRPGTPTEKGPGLFSTDLTLHDLAAPFAATARGNVRPLVEEDRELYEAFRVLLDEDEFDLPMGIGFAGKPNLGCVVMSRYLRKHLPDEKRAKAFSHALEHSSRVDGSKPRVAVVGSVFGGTGASLLPVAQPCFEAYFNDPDAGGNPRDHLFDRLRWGKVMLLPYFKPPSDRPHGGSGGPNLGRHSIDTSGALWYYGQNEATREPVYLIGSSSPERRIIRPAAGRDEQRNPAFYHEILAALAVLDFHHRPELGGDNPIRHFSAAGGRDKATESCSLIDLPGFGDRDGASVRRHLAILFHLAAFSVDWVLTKDYEYHQGLFQYAKKSTLTGWPDCVHAPLAANRESLSAQQDTCQTAQAYFARLLLWGQTTLGSSKYGSSGLDYAREPGQYASLHNTLCAVPKDEVEVPVNGRFPAETDNLAAKICRLAVAGLLRENETRGGKEFRGHRLGLPRHELLVEDATIRLGTLPGSLAKSLDQHGHKATDITGWFDECGD